MIAAFQFQPHPMAENKFWIGSTSISVNCILKYLDENLKSQNYNIFDIKFQIFLLLQLGRLYVVEQLLSKRFAQDEGPKIRHFYDFSVFEREMEVLSAYAMLS